MTPTAFSLVPAAESFALHLARVAATLALTPPFGEKGVTRLGVVALAAWIAFSLVALSPAAPAASPLALALAVVGEVGLGLLLGFAIRLALLPVEIAAGALSQEAGLSLTGNLDPSLQQPATPLDVIMRRLGLLVFVGLGGPEAALRLVARTFELVPAGAVSLAALRPAALVPALVARSAESALELALPVIAAGFLASSVLAVLGRSLPRLNLLTDALSLRTAAVLVALVVFLPFTTRATAAGLARLERGAAPASAR